MWFEGIQLPESLVPEEQELEADSEDQEDNFTIASSDEDESSDDEEDLNL